MEQPSRISITHGPVLPSGAQSRAIEFSTRLCFARSEDDVTAYLTAHVADWPAAYQQTAQHTYDTGIGTAILTHYLRRT